MADDRTRIVSSLGDGLQVEMEKVDFERRLDTKEDRLNDGEQTTLHSVNLNIRWSLAPSPPCNNDYSLITE